MRYLTIKILFSILLLPLLSPALANAEDPKKPQGPPPMLVEVTEITRGSAEPLIELIGTVRSSRVSRVAAEISGIVEQLHFNEGQRVTAGQPLVSLRNDLLKTRLAGTRADHQQVLIKLERARKDLQRIKSLFEEQSVAESLYDENHYGVLAQEQQAAALKATLDLQLLEIKKTSIRSPFNGLVQSKLVEKGEWVGTGGQVAIIADDHALEVHVEVPQQLLGYLQNDPQLSVNCAGQDYAASFISFIPQGNVATRTFTVKLKLKNAAGLIEGMEARAKLPNGPRREGLLVPRDAVLKQFGKDVIFLAVQGQAKAVNVQIQGYQGMLVAIDGAELHAGDMVVIKGNERIREGQAIRF